MATAHRDKSPSLDEKVDPIHAIEYGDENDPDAGLTDDEKAAADRAVVRKLDYMLIPWLCLLYLASFLDRSNIGNAKIEGLLTDLKMSSTQYNLSLTIFFISYSLFEPLSNILLKRMRPSIYIPLIMTLWGLVMTLMGLSKSFSGLMAARWFLGLTEAGLFPGVTYYLSCWYRRREFGIRIAIFFSAAAVSGSFGGLLAAAISRMKGLGGIKGWAWIFIIEGLATIVIGVASFWMVYDFPDIATFLTPIERARVLKRLREDQQASANHEEFDMKYFYQSVSDWKTYTGMVMYMGVAGALYAFSMFLPTLIKELGYTSTQAQLLTVPVYAVACFVTIIVGWWADSSGQRGLFNIFMSLFGVAGFLILIVSRNTKLSYAATFLAAIGIYPCIANTLSWVSNNVEGVYKRGVTIGFVIGWGNLNGIMSSNVYRAKDAPHFTLGHSIVFGYLTVCLFGGSVVNYIWLRRENKARLAGERDHLTEGKTQAEIDALGDMRPDFIYTT